MVDLRRRGFLFGRARPPEAQIRPPWALAEDDFIARCTRCDGCRQACPQQIIVSGNGGFPTVDFSNAECTFCGDCAAACEPRALKRDAASDAPPWPYKAIIAGTCLAEQRVECRSCGDHCDANAIRFSPQLNACPIPDIDFDKCTGCGACVEPCPVTAIRIG